jgi:DNA primase
MGLIPDNVIGEIRKRSDIVAVIGRHVQLRKAGQNHKGLCPFHNENTPSFNVNGTKGFFYCFGCHKKGDVFSFVMEYEGKSFVEAAESLAGQLGIVIERTEEPEHVRRQRDERVQLLRVNKLATEFYRRQLCSDHGSAGRRYLADRGIGDTVAETFQLGLAPDSWSTLTDYLAHKRVPMHLAETLGLVVPRKSEGHYDRFRDRLMCPIVLPGGEIAGFSGRRLGSGDDDKAGAKYINSPESPVYKKSRLLFGLHAARDAFRKRKRAVLVEGNFDVMALHEAGFAETVAPLGTALTREQADQLRRLADKVVLMYDGDKAGQAATLKALRVLVAADVDVRIVVVPPGDDPDTLVKRLRPDKFGEMLERAQGGIQYFAYEIWGKNTGSDHSQAQVLSEAASVILAIRNPTKRDLVVGILAKALNIPPQVVQRSLSRARGQRNSEQKQQQRPVSRAPAAPAAPAAPPPDLDELALLAILAEHPQLRETAEQNSVFSLLTDERLRDMYCAARQNRSYLSNPSEWPEDLSALVAKQMLAGAYADVKDPKHCLIEAIGGLKRLQRAKLAALKREAQTAKRRGDVELERKLVREILITRRQVD